MKVCLLGSGSKGNSIYLESGGYAILVDQGFAHRRIAERLASRGLDCSRIRALLVSHEHHDHIRGVGVTARKLGVPVYATAATLDGGRSVFAGTETLVPFVSGDEIALGPFRILPYQVSHDAADPVQFCLTANGRKVSIATDLGFVSTLVSQCLAGSDLVIIEANHDIDMLRKGSYPWPLKQRIMGRFGHLSNRNAADLAFNLCTNGRGPRIVLAHLSQENNTALVAEETVRELFAQFDRRIRQLIIATQDEATDIIDLSR